MSTQQVMFEMLDIILSLSELMQLKLTIDSLFGLLHDVSLLILLLLFSWTLKKHPNVARPYLVQMSDHQVL